MSITRPQRELKVAEYDLEPQPAQGAGRQRSDRHPDPAPQQPQPQRRPAAVRPRRRPVHRDRRRRRRQRPARERPEQGQPDRQDPADRPAPADGRPYTIPSDNPFVGRAARATRSTPTVCATRGASPSTAATGELAIGDVGQDTCEEIDYERPDREGRQLGWDAFEGSKPLRLRLTRSSTAEAHRSGRSSTTHTRRAAAARSPAVTSCATTGSPRSTAATCTATSGRPDPLADSAHERRSRRPLSRAAEPSGNSSFGVDAHRHLYLTNVSNGALSEVVPKG